MSLPSPLDGREDEIVALLREGVAKAEIARRMGVSTPSVCRAVKRIARRSAAGAFGTDPVLPGFEIASISTTRNGDGSRRSESIRQRLARPDEAFEVPARHEVKGVSVLTDGDGRIIQQWTKTRAAELTPEEVVERLKAGLEGYGSPWKPFEPPQAVVSPRELLTVIPVNDWHIGMYAWSREAGESWDLSIAEKRLGEATTRIMEMTPGAGTCVLLVGGDLLHADNMEAKTARSGNVLDVDGRYAKVLETAARLLVHAVGAALKKHGRVIVRILRGNHDDHSALAAALFLKAWFRSDPCVEVDTDPGLFWWYRFGQVMLGSTHGHTVKPDQMAQIMAARRPADWGATQHRYVHTFHLHHKRLYGSEEGGVITEVHQAPIPQDAWHYGAGFLSGRSMQAITYDAVEGEVARVRISLGSS